MVKFKDLKLFTAGPVACFPEVLEAMATQMFSHRSPEYKELHMEVVERLQRFLETKQTVMLFPSSGSGVMEASIRNCIPHGKKVLVTIIGAFGKRYAEVVESNGRVSVKLEVPEPGLGITPEDLDDVLQKNPDVEAVTITYNETSVGVLNPLKELAKVAKEHEKMVFVDAVSAMGGADIKFDEWGLDIVFASSQKAFGIPPGLAMAAFSDEVFERAKKIPERGWYFDLLLYKKYQEVKKGTPSTPPIPQIIALNVILEKIEREYGKKKWLEMYEKRSSMIREGVKNMGLEIVAKPGFESPTITAVYAPEGVSGKEVYFKMREKGYELAQGYGELKEKTFRIGNMGYMTFEDIKEMLQVLEEVIEELRRK